MKGNKLCYSKNNLDNPYTNRLLEYMERKLSVVPENIDFFCAGGAIRNFFERDKDRKTDFDLFFKTEESAQACYNALLTAEFELLVETPFAWKLKNSNKDIYIDVCKRLFQSSEEILDTFDFTVTCAVVERNSNEYSVKLTDLFLFAMIKKKLLINNAPFPVSTLKRVPKYIAKGYAPCKGTLLTLMNAIRQLSEEEMQEQKIFYID